MITRGILLSLLLMPSCAGEGIDVDVVVDVASGLNASLISKESGIVFAGGGLVEDLSATKCKAGYFCLFNSTAQIPCPLGTFNPSEGQSACVNCPLGTYSFSNETRRATCEQCPKGSYTLTVATQRLDQCLPCSPGYSCAAAAPTPCPMGTYNPYQGRTECVACPLGTYSDDERRLSVCLPCPANSICPTPSKRIACPAQTASAEGSTFSWDCKCLSGYECLYRSQVAVHFKFNSTQMQQNATTTMLEGNAPLIDALRLSVARASGVDLSKVTFKGFRLVVAR
jgi:hypothetical protein